MERPVLQIKYLPNAVGKVAYGSELASGFDLQAAISEDIVLKPFETKLVPTGVAVGIPADYTLDIRSRSGLSLKQGLVAKNSPGTIDPDYRGEIGIILYNASNDTHTVKRGDRIAQAVFVYTPRPTLEEVSELSETVRGAGGFGSTGVAHK